MSFQCTLGFPGCQGEVNPTSRFVYQRITGWERMAGVRPSGKHGGSDIVHRERQQNWACPSCIARLGSSGGPNQEPML